MEQADYNKSRLNFVLKRDALKNAHSVGGALLNMVFLLFFNFYLT